MMPSPHHHHPLAGLSKEEMARARDVVVKSHGGADTLFFRSIHLQEPSKAHLVPFLEAEHAGALTDKTPRPPRLARVEYDNLGDGAHRYVRSVVHLESGQILTKDVAQDSDYPYFTM